MSQDTARGRHLVADVLEPPHPAIQQVDTLKKAPAYFIEFAHPHLKPMHRPLEFAHPSLEPCGFVP